MGWVIAALVLGVFLNMSSVNGVSWPIGSVVAIVIMGIWLKVNQDAHFEELEKLMKGNTEERRSEDDEDRGSGDTKN